MKESIKIPREQKAIIAAALKVYQKVLHISQNEDKLTWCLHKANV